MMSKKNVMLIDKVHSSCTALIPRGARVVVAVSGGGDSVALLMALVALQSELGLAEIAVAHVNHNLRGAESKNEMTFVRALARHANLVCHVKKLNPAHRVHESIESWARRERYAFFAGLKKKYAYHAIATGHTADDQAETVYMRLSRGCGLFGLRGILPKREDGVVRPLLSVHGAELRQWLAGQNIPFCEDSSNSSTDFMRNRIRRYLGAQPRRLRKQLCAIAEYAQAAWPLVERDLANWEGRNVVCYHTKSFEISKTGLSESIAPEAVAQCLRRYAVEVNNRHINSFFVNTKRQSGRFLLPGLWSYYPLKKSVIFEKKGALIKNKEIHPTVKLKIPGQDSVMGGELIIKAQIGKKIDIKSIVSYDKSEVLVDKNIVNSAWLGLRLANQLDQFIAFGSKRTQKLMYYLKNQGINKFTRKRTVVVTQPDGRIVWVVGVQIGQWCKITDETKEVIKLSMHKQTNSDSLPHTDQNTFEFSE